MTKSSINVASDENPRKMSTNRHQLVRLALYLEPMHGILDSGALQIVISAGLAENLGLQMSPTRRRYHRRLCKRTSRDSCKLRRYPRTSQFHGHQFTIVRPHNRISKFSWYVRLYVFAPQTVKVRKDGKAETLNLLY